MLKKILPFALGLALLAACNSAPQADTAEVTESIDSTKAFGAAFDMAEGISYDQLAGQMTEGVDSLTEIVLTGKVEDVCQKAGCWMKISSAEGRPAMRVTFKDYGFFVPKDLAGKAVTMKGVAYRTVTSVDDLRHYAEDAGKSAEEIAAITEPEEELTFEALGVVINE